jgi:hypothetical protein
MTSFRRAQSNFALDRAIEHARDLKKPLVIFEALRVDYPFASDRLHTFLFQGMADNARRFERADVTYFPYAEERPGDGKGLLEALAARACVVVGDDWPCFFVPRMQAAAATRLDVRFEVVDSNGLFPMHATTRVFTTAHSFRVHLQKELKRHLEAFPNDVPLRGLRLPRYALPQALLRRWPRAPMSLLEAKPEAIASGRRASRRQHRGPRPPRSVHRREARTLRPLAEPTGGGRNQRAVTLAALRPRLDPRDFPGTGEAAAVVPQRVGLVHRRGQRRLVEAVAGRRSLRRNSLPGGNWPSTSRATAWTTSRRSTPCPPGRSTP